MVLTSPGAREPNGGLIVTAGARAVLHRFVMLRRRAAYLPALVPLALGVVVEAEPTSTWSGQHQPGYLLAQSTQRDRRERRLSAAIQGAKQRSRRAR